MEIDNIIKRATKKRERMEKREKAKNASNKRTMDTDTERG